MRLFDYLLKGLDWLSPNERGSLYYLEDVMKRLLSVLPIILASVFTTSTFADIAATTITKWDATAKKDTTSSLVVTPMRSLTFQYAEGLNEFSSQNGAFDVTIQGQGGATDFELTTKLMSNTLKRTSDASTLDVGVKWNGQKLAKNTETTLIDTANNISAGLDTLAEESVYASADRNSAQGNFKFTVDSATSDGTAAAEFQDLTDGVWDGEVAVQFTANWVTP